MKTSTFKTIRVRSSAGDYAVVCGRGLLGETGREIARLGEFSSVHVLSSPKVWRALGAKLKKGLGARQEAAVHLFDDAEAAKNMATVEAIARKLARAGADPR